MMKKNKALVLGPITAEAGHLEQLRTPLGFLSQDFELEILDPLGFDSSHQQGFYQQWQRELTERWSEYDLIIGFSFGGMILQKFLTAVRPENKTIVLFSAPIFSDHQLKSKLQKVVSYCEQERLSEALEMLYTWVFSPGQPPALSVPKDTTTACQRLISGLKLVIETDLRPELNRIDLPYFHFYGENSALVGRDQLGDSTAAHFVEVPQSSMRVLEDQPALVKQLFQELTAALP